MMILKTFGLKSMLGDYNFDFTCSMARGTSGGLVSMWDPNSFIKDDIWCDDAFIIMNRLCDFIHQHTGKYIIFGYMNVVHNENERSVYLFSKQDADNFNSFIDNSGLIHLPLGGHLFTWMNEAGTKLKEKYEVGYANDDDHDSRIKLLQEVDRLNTFESFDLFQKAREEFLKFKKKFKDQDSNVDFPPFANSSRLCALDRDSLETLVSLVEVKNADDIKVDILEYVNIFLDTGSFPHGSNSSFFTLITKKAFNSLSWKYLDFVLLNLGLDLNGILGLELIYPHPGLRFSSMGLHNALSATVSSGLIRGVKFGSPEVFYLASGLKINIQKSNVYGIGVSDIDVSSMASNYGCALGCFPFTYLGLPIGSNISLTSSWHVLLDRFQSKLSSWKANLLSIGGRHTLIKDVLGNLVLKLSTSPFSKSGVRGCYRTRTRSRLKLSKLYMVRKVALITMVASIMVISCPSFNGNMESSNHIYFECNIAKDIWILVGKWCDISFPPITSYKHWKGWFTSWQVVKEKSWRLSVIFSSSLWWLWRYHNSVTFRSPPDEEK
ncbi:hypothetical protein Tco_0938640 [Tanacetum coccineum]|uniref:Uncharacterized protein n=1 Tax=Tanacetum coccineum TaxID=301880 RepID=A0ABQ5DHR7_9ASTR